MAQPGPPSSEEQRSLTSWQNWSQWSKNDVNFFRSGNKLALENPITSITSGTTSQLRPGYPHSSACCSQIVCRSGTKQNEILTNTLGDMVNLNGTDQVKSAQVQHMSVLQRKRGYKSETHTSNQMLQRQFESRNQLTGQVDSAHTKPCFPQKTESSEGQFNLEDECQMLGALRYEQRKQQTVHGQRSQFSMALPHPSKIFRHRSRGRPKKKHTSRSTLSNGLPKSTMEDRILTHAMHIKSKQLARTSSVPTMGKEHASTQIAQLSPSFTCPQSLSTAVNNPDLQWQPVRCNDLPHVSDDWHGCLDNSTKQCEMNTQPLSQQKSAVPFGPSHVFDQASLWQDDVNKSSETGNTDCCCQGNTFEMEQ